MSTPSRTARRERFNTASLLCLQPLWRVQVNHQRAIIESSVCPAGAVRDDLPYLYFQRVVEGRLELRSTGGRVELVDPSDVCDVIPCVPIIVQAMPRTVFLERLADPLVGALAGADRRQRHQAASVRRRLSARRPEPRLRGEHAPHCRRRHRRTRASADRA